MLYFQANKKMSKEVETSNEVKCKYCLHPVITFIQDWFKCIACEGKVHDHCLKRLSTPGGIHGDTYFYFTCIDCSESDSEILEREKMSWFKIIVLVLHHLHFKSIGTARNGYFHWRTHILKFIEKNWDILLPKNLYVDHI